MFNMEILKRKSQVVDTLIIVGRDGSEYKQKLDNSEESEQCEDKEIIIEKTAAEIIHQINARVKSPYYSFYCAILGTFLFLLSLKTSIILATVVAFFGVFGCLFLYADDVKRKTTPLLYRFSDEYSRKKFQEGISCFLALSSTKKAWQLKSKIPIHDWKRNAGSDSALARNTSRIGKQNPKLLKTNIEVWGIDAGNIKIYLFPDHFLVFGNGSYKAVPYKNTEAILRDLEHVEQDLLPDDAMIIGERWKNIRRDGERDLRFKNNRKLPVVRYSLLRFNLSDTTIQVIISSHEAAKKFGESFLRFLDLPVKPAKQENKSEDLYQEEGYFLEHLEPLRLAASKGKEMTTSQIAELLKVSSSFVTKNPISFEYEGFRFSRAGRLGRQISWRIEYLNQK